MMMMITQTCKIDYVGLLIVVPVYVSMFVYGFAFYTAIIMHQYFVLLLREQSLLCLLCVSADILFFLKGS